MNDQSKPGLNPGTPVPSGFKLCPVCNSLVDNESNPCPNCSYQFRFIPVTSEHRRQQGVKERSPASLAIRRSVRRAVPFAVFGAAFTILCALFFLEHWSANESWPTSYDQKKSQFESHLRKGMPESEVKAVLGDASGASWRVDKGRFLPHGDYAYYILADGAEGLIYQNHVLIQFDFSKDRGILLAPEPTDRDPSR